MGQPADRVALAAAGRVLHQVVDARAGVPGIGLQLPHHVQLLVPREKHRFPLDRPAFDLLGDHLQV